MALSITGMALTTVMDDTVLIATGISLVNYEIDKVGWICNDLTSVRRENRKEII